MKLIVEGCNNLLPACRWRYMESNPHNDPLVVVLFLCSLMLFYARHFAQSRLQSKGLEPQRWRPFQ